MANYRLKNEGEARPTRMVGTPLGKRPTPPKPEPFDPTTKKMPQHRGFLAVYDRLASSASDAQMSFGVDVVRITRSWATVRVIRSSSSSQPPVNEHRTIKPGLLRPPTSGELFWWSWPNRDAYDYDAKLAEALSAARVAR